MTGVELDLARLAAIVFAVMTLGVVAFQFALAFGLPWGAYAMGGAFPGKYPVRMRVAAVYPGVYDNFLIVVSFVFCGLIVWYAWGWSGGTRAA